MRSIIPESVGLYTVLIEIFDFLVLENFEICSFFCLITEHRANSFPSTMVITFAVSPISAVPYIVVNIVLPILCTNINIILQ